MWSAARANLNELTAEAVFANAPTLFLKNVHFYRLRKECFTSTMKLVIANFKKLFLVHWWLPLDLMHFSRKLGFSHSKMLDVFQGSRLMARITELLHDYFAAKLHQIVPAALPTPKDTNLIRILNPPNFTNQCSVMKYCSVNLRGISEC